MDRGATTIEISLANEAATGALGAAIAQGLKPRDCLMLEGDVGAGKTALARAIILPLLPEPEDIPSPTFTLVQTYEAEAFTIWHCDLYRLSDPSELVELGIADAFEEDVTLIEWPDRLGSAAPAHAQRLHLTVTGEESRALSVEGDTRWAELARALG